MAKHSSFKKLVDEAMSEVHRNIPSTVQRASVSGMKKEKMMRAIAFAKVRKKGAKIPKKRK